MGLLSIFTDPFMNRRRVAIFTAIAVPLWALTAFLLLQESQPDHKRVVLVVIDGLRSDALRDENLEMLPAFSYLIRTGASTLNARTDVRNTMALPNIVSILTGRPVYDSEVPHKYTANTYSGKAIHDVQEKYIHSIFDVLYTHRYRNAFFASGNKMGLFIKSYTATDAAKNILKGWKNPSRFQSYVVTEDDQITFDSFLIELKNFDAYHIFLHLAGTEYAGRKFGWNTKDKNSEYMREVIKIDHYLGEILKAVQRMRHLRGKVYLIVTSSHGGNATNPELFQEPENFTIPFLVWGPQVARGADLYALNSLRRHDPGKFLIPFTREPPPIRNAEAGNLALKLLELPAIPYSVVNGLQSLRVNASANP